METPSYSAYYVRWTNKNGRSNVSLFAKDSHITKEMKNDGFIKNYKILEKNNK